MLPDVTYPPQGAFPQPDGSALWRVWAPHKTKVELVTWPGNEPVVTEMTKNDQGYFECRRDNCPQGLRYAYAIDDGPMFPDPASRWQPEGVHRPSALFDPLGMTWSDSGWKGVPTAQLVLYELHVGTFTPEGTFDAIIPRLEQLVELGITAIELMPVSQFPGNRNWGYDGVHLYATQDSYGGPHALQRLVDAAHRAGLAVILDVVYNHFGPEGNYLREFGPYFTNHYATPWGQAVNYDGPWSDPVRQFAIDNALMWVRDFHVDGLRLDAVHAIYDMGAKHLLAELRDVVHDDAAAQGRTVHVIAESHQNDVRLTDPHERGGYGLDGVWADDFHHAVHTILTGELDGYYKDFGSPEHLSKTLTDVFVYDGCYSPFRYRRHGSKVGNRDRSQFVICIQNHDQVGNRAVGDRFGTMLTPAAQRLAAALMLISPCTPLLFMGEEYGETRPFPFFCSFEDPALVEAVRQGRRREFADLAFRWGVEIPDPQSEQTFESAKLLWDYPQGSVAAGLRLLYRDLIAARRNWPALANSQRVDTRLVTAGQEPEGQPGVLVILRGDRSRIVALANLSSTPQPSPQSLGGEWTMLLSTEDRRYRGERENAQAPDLLLPYEMFILGPRS